MKACIKCEYEKPLSDFYRHPQMADGHLNKCKECARIDVRANRSANREYYLAYDRARANLPHRVTARKKYQKCPAGIDAHRKGARAWAERNKHKRSAHSAVSNALRSGRLVRGRCEVCGTNRNVQGHHDDYSKPLDVRWLCVEHHAEHHVNERNLKKETSGS